jgi:hypothetical protein
MNWHEVLNPSTQTCVHATLALGGIASVCSFFAGVCVARVGREAAERRAALMARWAAFQEWAGPPAGRQ